VGTKTRLMYRDAATWWRVGIKSGWRGGGSGMGSDWSSEESSSGGGGGGCLWMVLGIELRSEERKAARGWQIRSVVGYVWCWSTYVRSSEGSAGGRANGVGDMLLSEGIRESDAWLRRGRSFWLLE
jgi:hypothetical protein